VGTIVGDCVGILVGWRVGIIVGDCVGIVVGDAVGASDNCRVGIDVGILVGVAVDCGGEGVGNVEPKLASHARFICVNNTRNARYD